MLVLYSYVRYMQNEENIFLCTIHRKTVFLSYTLSSHTICERPFCITYSQIFAKTLAPHLDFLAHIFFFFLCSVTNGDVVFFFAVAEETFILFFPFIRFIRLFLSIFPHQFLIFHLQQRKYISIFLYLFSLTDSTSPSIPLYFYIFL